ncbi:hypothetical protein GCM10023350_11700 [Nocardioides endophyticus]|uniref:DUF222 domain-containing protein n=1 Tax=Nocardioides endophyticus TaxID=1353775 RepID=A0ABP8YJT9_9ACTN
MGLQTDAARERVAAMTIMSGRTQPAASRDSLAESLVGDRGPVEKLLPGTRESARENTSKLESHRALSRVQRFHRDGVRLDDNDATRLLVAVGSIPIRSATSTRRVIEDRFPSAPARRAPAGPAGRAHATSPPPGSSTAR